VSAAPRDVVVVGAGPAGSASALLLSRAGLDVVLCDGARFPRDKVCGDTVAPAAWPVLRRLGVDASIRACGPGTIRGMRIVSPGGTEVSGDYPGGATGFALPRRTLDHLLLEAARTAGVEVREGTRVASVSRAGKGGWRAALGDGAALGARLVVLAYGRSGRLAGHRGRPPLSRPRFAVRGYWRGMAGLQDRGEMHVAGGGYCGVAPLGPEEANVTFVLDRAAFHGAGGRLEEFYRACLGAHWPLLHARLRRATLAAPPRAAGPLLVSLPRPFAGGAVCVGDAAGLLDPFTGEGTTLALRGAELAAAAAREALREGTDAALRAYHRAYRAETRSAFRLNRLILALVARPRLADAAARRLARRPAQAEGLIGMAGGVLPAGEALSPAFLWSLLRP
jgi:flavin-dependent dehydrogenase